MSDTILPQAGDSENVRRIECVWLTEYCTMSDTMVSDTGAEPPFRAEHVGSLLRPAALLAARAEYEGGGSRPECCAGPRMTASGTPSRCRTSLASRGSPTASFAAAPGTWISSIRSAASKGPTARLHIAFKNEGGTVEFAPAAHRVAGRLSLDKTIFAEDFAFLKSVAPPGTTPKLTIPSPSMLHYRGGRAAIDPATYPELDAFWHDLAAVYRQEIAGLRRSAAPICSSTTRASPI